MYVKDIQNSCIFKQSKKCDLALIKAYKVMLCKIDLSKFITTGLFGDYYYPV